MNTIDTVIGESITRMNRLATAIEVADDNRGSSELWMRLENAHLATLLAHRASYNTRPDLDWSWVPGRDTSTRI